MSNERVLVTGGAGMIGSTLVKRLVANGYDVSVVDNLWRGKKEYLTDQGGNYVIDMDAKFHELDLSIAGVADELFANTDYVFHLADVVAGVKYIFENQGSVFRQNVLINSNAITSARKVKLSGFIYVGTACSFPEHLQNGVDSPPLKEADQYPASPESAYGWSKLMGEYESLLMEKELGTPVGILSLHNVYGTPCNYEEARGQVLPSLVRKAILYPEVPFDVWGSGQQGRAFVHVDDVVDALMATMTKGLGKGVVQIGPDVCTRLSDLADMIVEVSGRDIEIQFDPSKPEGDLGRRADYSKAREVLGWEPRVDLKEGIAGVYEWMSARLQ